MNNCSERGYHEFRNFDDFHGCWDGLRTECRECGLPAADYLAEGWVHYE
jgi:hypothetical protein